MALNLKYQTGDAFVARFWLKVQQAQERNQKPEFARLCWWLIERVNAGDITDAQARTAFNAVFVRTLTPAQWTAMKNTRLTPAHDRHASALAEGNL